MDNRRIRALVTNEIIEAKDNTTPLAELEALQFTLEQQLIRVRGVVGAVRGGSLDPWRPVANGS